MGEPRFLVFSLDCCVLPHFACGHELFRIIICVFFTFSIGFVIRSAAIVHEYDVTKALKEELEKGDEGDSKKIETLKKKYQKMSKKDSAPKSSKRLTIFLIVFVIITIWLTFFMYTYLFIPVKLWNDFQLDITQITPYCELIEVVTLQSDWVGMSKKDDYDSIYNTISHIRESNGLPKLTH